MRRASANNKYKRVRTQSVLIFARFL